MKKLLVLAAIFVLLFAGCDDDAKENENGISFESFSPASVIVNNNSNERLVAFNSNLSPNSLIGGIPALAQNHGLEKKASLFSVSGDFILILITEDEYNKNKDNLASAQVFARLFSFFNNEAPNAYIVSISSKIGGTGRIIITNPMNFGVEIRLNSPNGELLGFAFPLVFNVELQVQSPESYILYPVLVRINPITMEIITIIPTVLDGTLNGQPYYKQINLFEGNDTVSWDLSELTDLVQLD